MKKRRSRAPAPLRAHFLSAQIFRRIPRALLRARQEARRERVAPCRRAKVPPKKVFRADQKKFLSPREDKRARLRHQKAAPLFLYLPERAIQRLSGFLILAT